MTDKKVMLIELNEFSVTMFESALLTVDLPNVRRLLNMRHSRTRTNDSEEHKGLDPWVQWVSVHTGVDSSEHGIKRLGDVPGLGLPQLWEVLSNAGISTGVWGAMNASRNNSEKCLFFLPDPWTFSEWAYPAKLNGLLRLPRYYAKNYLDVDIVKFIKLCGKAMLFLLTVPSMWKIGKHIPFILLGFMRFGRKDHYLFSIFDLVSVLVFIHFKGKYKPDFSLVFLNSIAHAQHHVWNSGKLLSEPAKYSVQAIDKALGQLFNSTDKREKVVIMNALTQRNIVDVKSDILYRQKNPEKFLTQIGIEFVKVEQLMTNDGHVFFVNKSQRDKAFQVLKNAFINEVPMFEVECDRHAQNKLFFQLDYWKALEAEACFEIDGSKHQFFDHFEKVVERTGEHIPVGDIYTDAIDFPSELYNHEINRYVVDYFATV